LWVYNDRFPPSDAFEGITGISCFGAPIIQEGGDALGCEKNCLFHVVPPSPLDAAEGFEHIDVWEHPLSFHAIGNLEDKRPRTTSL